MKQEYIFVNQEERSKTQKLKLDKVKGGILTTFAVCMASLFIFFTVSDKAPKNENEENKIVSVFKETYLSDFLDLESYENDEGSV